MARATQQFKVQSVEKAVSRRADQTLGTIIIVVSLTAVGVGLWGINGPFCP